MTKLFWLVVAAAILAGVAFRIEHVAGRTLSKDEAWTALRLSGHTYDQVMAFYDERVHSRSDILRFQGASAARNVQYTVRDLAHEEPQHAPLFYIFDRFWAAAFGNSVADIRAPALLFGLAAIVGAFWFAFELTGSSIVGGSAAALMAVSPFFVAYSGQAREYSLWALSIAVTSALLLRALRTGSAGSWVWYGIAIAVSLYSEVLMAGILVAHAAYVFFRRDAAALRRFSAAVSLAIVLFLPWILAIVHARQDIIENESWTHGAYPLRIFLERWGFNIAATLFDAEYAHAWFLALAIAILAVIAYAVFRLIRNERRRISALIVLLGASIAAPQLVLDFVTHGHASLELRYMLPLWLALLLAVALLFGRGIESTRVSTVRATCAGFCALVLLSAFSAAVGSRQPMWWDNLDDVPVTSVAAAINGSPAPLVVTDASPAEVLVMAHYVRSDARFMLLYRIPHALPTIGSAFLLRPSQAMMRALANCHRCNITPIHIAKSASEPLRAYERTLQGANAPHYLRLGRPTLYRLTQRVARRRGSG